ncbi:hypothetical protein [Reyranella sp.]|uniref:hypothetical protein n=1 Tax=Reyranella sp. TaxID=1929291 RepID=UPI0040364A22
MAVQLSVAARNARLDAIETTIGTTPTLEIRTGAAPASCAASDSGTVLATFTLPSDWMAAASSGAKAIANGPWQDTSADASGTAAHFRIKASGGTVHLQGTVGQGSGDLSLDNTTIVAGQTVSITAFTLTDANS